MVWDSNSGVPEESPRGCIIATNQMFGLVSKDNEDLKDGFHALFIDSRQTSQICSVLWPQRSQR
jgi:hypothetical protein